MDTHFYQLLYTLIQVNAQIACKLTCTVYEDIKHPWDVATFAEFNELVFGKPLLVYLILTSLQVSTKFGFVKQRLRATVCAGPMPSSQGPLTSASCPPDWL